MQPLLSVLLAARHPPTDGELQRAALTLDASMTANEFRRRMQVMRKLLVPAAGGAWLIFHSSFAEWLCDVKHCTQRFLVRVAEGHARWAVSLAALGADLSRCQAADLTFHLSRMSIEPPLEAWHLPLWLLW